MNSSGQAFTVFRFLIAAIFAAVVLFIILAAVNYFDSLKRDLCNREVFQAFESAASIPDRTVITVKQCTLGEGQMFTAKALGTKVNLAAGCISFDRAAGYSEVEMGGNSIRTLKPLRTDIFVWCSEGHGDCPIECTLSLGEKP